MNPVSMLQTDEQLDTFLVKTREQVLTHSTKTSNQVAGGNGGAELVYEVMEDPNESAAEKKVTMAKMKAIAEVPQGESKSQPMANIMSVIAEEANVNVEDLAAIVEPPVSPQAQAKAVTGFTTTTTTTTTTSTTSPSTTEVPKKPTLGNTPTTTTGRPKEYEQVHFPTTPSGKGGKVEMSWIVSLLCLVISTRLFW